MDHLWCVFRLLNTLLGSDDNFMIYDVLTVNQG